MRIFPPAAKDKLNELGASRVLIVGEHGIIQWHNPAGTLVAEGPYEVIGQYDPDFRSFSRWGVREVTTGILEEQADRVALEAVGGPDAVELVGVKNHWYYAVRSLDAVPPAPALNELITDLAQRFVICMAGLEEGKQNYAEHRHLVGDFQRRFDAFLAQFKGQSVGTFAAAITALGVPHDRALMDVVFLNNLYRSLSAAPAESSPNGESQDNHMRLPSESERGEIVRQAQWGRSCLKLESESAGPAQIVAAIQEMADQLRAGTALPAGNGNVAALADVLGALWGDQLCRQCGWEWIWLEKLNVPAGWAVASPDRAHACYPGRMVHRVLDQPESDNSIALTFDQVSAGDLPPSVSGRYLLLP